MKDRKYLFRCKHINAVVKEMTRKAEVDNRITARHQNGVIA
jgi:hypothetical protein